MGFDLPDGKLWAFFDATTKLPPDPTVAAFEKRAKSPAVTITYNGDGTVASVTENGVTTTYTYNGDGTVATDTRAGVTRTYTYDGSGNLTGITVS